MKNMKFKETKLLEDLAQQIAFNLSATVILETFKMSQSYKTLRLMMQFSKKISQMIAALINQPDAGAYNKKIAALDRQLLLEITFGRDIQPTIALDQEFTDQFMLVMESKTPTSVSQFE